MSAFVFPRPDFPPLAHTGGFGEPTCAQCHTGDPVNSPGGALTLDSLPARWRPGATYRVVVTLRHDSLARAGFEIAARFLDGSQAGGFAPADTAMTRVSADTAATHVQFAHHTRAGTRAAVQGREASWALFWTAPRRRDAVVFHAAAVAANDDESNLGDYVLTLETRARSR